MMKHTSKKLVSLILLLMTTGMAGTWRKKDIQHTYSENLSVHRKSFKISKTANKKTRRKTYRKRIKPITPTHAVNDQLDYLLARKKAVNAQVEYVQGYTIQVYAGGSREEAFKVRNKLYTHCPAITPEVTYHLPNYTVSLGRFLDRLEAYPAYDVVRKLMPQAIIRPIALVNRPHIFMNK
ncbi:MAG: hypothetical protein ACX93T_03585 [Bacteroidota bacterium]